MKQVVWETECGWELFDPEPVRTFIFGMNMQDAHRIAREEGLHPYGRDVLLMGSEVACRGVRVEPGDDVLVSSGFWLREDAHEIRQSFVFAGVDLHHVPVTEYR